MGKLILALAFTYLVAVGLGMIPKAHSAEHELMGNSYAGCVEQAINGYGSGMEQRWCELNYPGLPSPFTFRCVSYIDKGFPTELDAMACVLHFGTYKRDMWAQAA